MEVFEVHITGDKSILTNAMYTMVKTIEIELLKPDGSVLRTEYMTSQVYKFENYTACKAKVDQMVKDLTSLGTKIIRVKIESPYYAHYVNQSLYIEAHFEDDRMIYPSSKNIMKWVPLATTREYDKAKYTEFRKAHDGLENIELCLYDSDIHEDKDWFDLYEAA